MDIEDIHFSNTVFFLNVLSHLLIFLEAGAISLRETCPNTEFFLIRIFPHLEWVRGDTPYLSVFSQNAGKYWPEKTPYLDTFHAVFSFLSKKSMVLAPEYTIVKPLYNEHLRFLRKLSVIKRCPLYRVLDFFEEKTIYTKISLCFTLIVITYNSSY